MMLPLRVIKTQTKKVQETKFAGYNHNLVTNDSELWDAENITFDDYPAMSVRKSRETVATLNAAARALCANRQLFWVDGATAYYNGTAINGLTLNGTDDITAVSIGDYICIWPNKIAYNVLSGAIVNMEATLTTAAGATVTFSDGTYADEYAEGCELKFNQPVTGFEVGDAIAISGCSISKYNITAIIRAISDDNRAFTFYEHTFDTSDCESSDTISGNTYKYYTQNGGITLKREIPAAEFVTECDNRLWCCKDNTIMCTKLGRPFVWYNYDATADSSYVMTVGTPGAFTGAATYLGYPIFFKEDAIHKIYGYKPSNYQDQPDLFPGVMHGCAKSIAIVTEKLYYKARRGIMVYTGDVPVLVSQALGNTQYSSASAGSDNGKYYVSMYDGTEHQLFTYDPSRRLWAKEDSIHANRFCFHNGTLYFSSADDYKLYSLTGDSSDGVEWYAEFNDYTDNSPDKKGVVSLQIRLRLDAGAELFVYIAYDGGEYREVKHIRTTGSKQSYFMPIKPRRCDHYRLRLEGRGGCTVYSIARSYYVGSPYRADSAKGGILT